MLSEREIFASALAIENPAERESYLKQVCGDDVALRARLDAELNLAFYQPPGATADLEQAPGLTGNSMSLVEKPGSSADAVGRLIGNYKLLQKIGEGGFGVVYMAEQLHPMRRNVALKIIKPGMDTRAVVARFEAERQALAMMDHANIAKVFDGGTVDDRPYFVMELVKGIPITGYCDKNNLSVRDRLMLFSTVCLAVQHAHQKGIIHRDIKPSNVMVTLHDGQPVVKVIDFGVAKAVHQRLTERTMFTEYGQMIGTPQYMSPEQAEMSGLDIDTRSDIYSLGVLLYELLTGSTPLEGQRLRTAGYVEMQRLIREEEPARPSHRLSTTGDELTVIARHRSVSAERLHREISGDLDWIVMKSLEKDRQRRYVTAREFEADIQRLLNDEPIEARPPSVVYRLRKLLRKHRGPVAAAAVVLASLVGGLAVSLALFARSEGLRHEADVARKQATAKAESEAAARALAESAQQSEQRQSNETRKALSQAEQNLYFSRIALADRYWFSNNVAQTDQILDACSPAHRHWEWNYLKRRCHPEIVRLAGHEGYEVAYSPDGKLLATTGPEGLIVLLDTATWKEVRSLRGHSSAVNLLAFSGDGNRLASAEYPNPTIRLWDVASGRELCTIQETHPIADLSVNHDGSRVATATTQTAEYGEGRVVHLHRAEAVRVWDTLTGKRILNLPNAGRQVALSADGKRVAAPVGNKLRLGSSINLWDVDSGQVAFTLQRFNYFPAAAQVTFSHDGERLASAPHFPNEVNLWDPATGKELRKFEGHNSPVEHFSFSSDGTCLATTDSEAVIKIWNVGNGSKLFSYRHNGAIGSVSLSPDGRQLASIGRDGTLRIWDATQRQEFRTVSVSKFRGGARSFALSADGRRIAATGFESTPIFSRLASLITNGARGETTGQILVYDLLDGKPRMILTPQGRTFRPGPVLENVVSYSIDGKLLASGNPNGSVQLWDAETGREIATFGDHVGAIKSLAFSPDSTRLVVADEGIMGSEFQGGGITLTKTLKPGAVKIWDVATQKVLLGIGDDMSRINSVAWSPDCQRVATAGFQLDKGHLIEIWDAANGKCLLELKGHTSNINSVTFSPDGRFLASGSSDETVRIWDAASGREILCLRGHTGWVLSVAFSPDGKRVVSTGDGTVKLWDPVSGQEILTLGDASGGHLEFSSNGRMIAAGGPDDITIWDASPPVVQRQLER